MTMKDRVVNKAMEAIQLKIDRLDTHCGIKGGKVVSGTGKKGDRFSLFFGEEEYLPAEKLPHIDLFLGGMLRASAKPAPAPEPAADPAPAPTKRAPRKVAPKPNVQGVRAKTARAPKKAAHIPAPASAL